MPDNMAARKHSTLNDIVGASAPRESRAEGVQDNHDRSIEALTEATSDMVLGEEKHTATSEQQSAAESEEDQHKHDATTAPSSSAVSKVLHTTELLEQIISHLSGPDLIAATNVNDVFYNCAVNSPDIQETLCLRPSTDLPPECYCIDRTRSDHNYNNEVSMSTIGLTPSAGMLPDDDDQRARICPIVRLCPALRSRESPGSKKLHKNRAKSTPFEEGDFDGDEFCAFTVQPSDISRLDMLVCDPSVTQATISLRYIHSETSAGVYISYHGWSKDSGFTLGAIFEKAKSVTYGSVCIDDGVNVVSGRPINQRRCNSTLEAVTSTYIRTHGGSFLLDLKVCYIRLLAVVPTEEEWETMRQFLAEEEAKKKLMDPDEHAAWMAKLLRW